MDWDKLTDVERTCLGVAFARWHVSAGGSMCRRWPDGKPWFTDPLGPLFVRGIPPARQQELSQKWSVTEKNDRWIGEFVAVRTAELDHRIADALKDGNIKQMVILGAGMDTRAFRLLWPSGFAVFEVDSPQVLDFKAKVLQGRMLSCDEQKQPQQQGGEGDGGEGSGVDDSEGAPVPGCKRCTVAADASNAEETWSRLVAAGLDSSKPTLWLMEGFIGYLTVDAGNALLKHLAANSTTGSRVLVTCPPRPEEKARSAAVVAAEAAAAGVAPEPDRLVLHHSTFEEPEDTLARVSAAGWSSCRLITAEQLQQKYDAMRAQPIVVGTKAK